MADSRKKSFLDFVRASLKGHIVFFLAVGAPCYFLLFLFVMINDGEPLTLGNLVRLLLASIFFGLLSAVLVWYGIAKKIKKKYDI